MPDMQLSRDEAKDLGAYIASFAKYISLVLCRILSGRDGF